MALSHGLTFAVLRSLDDRPLEAKRLTTILEAQDERVPKETPRHPIRSFQGPLEESLIENANPRKARWPSMPSQLIDSATRRRMLLQHLGSDETYTTRWRQRPDERHHPLTKLVAQISFGIHLLHKGLVKSDDEVIRILQTYVGEVDSFLEQTTEDFDLALNDIEERIKCLRLPLEHDEIFDAMLEDRVFRKQIVDGNEKIEHIINRTETAMNDALEDVQQGLEATKELAKYLVRLDRKWAHRTDEQDDVYAAMSGNSEGWFRCFFSLQTKGHTLTMMMLQLGTVVSELQRRAGVASRKNIALLITDNRAANEEAQAAYARAMSPLTSKALPAPNLRIMSPSPVEHIDRSTPEVPGKSMPSLESLTPSESTITPRRTMSGRRSPQEDRAREERSRSAMGVLEGRGTSSRASVRTQQSVSIKRGGSLREPRHHENCTCSCGAHEAQRSRTSLSRRSSPARAHEAQRSRTSLSHRSSLTRALSFRRKKPSIDSLTPPLTAESVRAPVDHRQPPFASQGTDSAYSSGESIVNPSSPEPDRMCSPAPTYTSDLYHPNRRPGSRINGSKAAAVMGMMQRSGSVRDREHEQEGFGKPRIISTHHHHRPSTAPNQQQQPPSRLGRSPSVVSTSSLNRKGKKGPSLIGRTRRRLVSLLRRSKR